MWVNAGEVPDDQIDNDGNGYVDDVYGYNFYGKNGDPMDDGSHGTHVAGTIGAVGNNAVGVVGVMHDVKIMALKFMGGPDGTGSTSDAVLAIEYATQMGATLTNNSWGGGGYSQSLYDAIAAAGAADQLFVAAAGNANNNNDLNANYSDSYNLDNIISVASSTSADNLSSFSNFGNTTVDIVAPGSNIYSTVPEASYGSKSGTSMAAPYVAGVLGLIYAANPSIRATDAKAALLGYLR
jgi:subtilisin family serine protease